MSEQIIKAEFSELMQKSYIDYAMSVICQRALPDVRDGLKPVQRRVLYAMEELGLSPDKPHRKSARIVGDTMGKYHPHGDSSIYEALVVMEQDFKKGMPLVDGHGNFGSIEGDGAAAMRYTEAKLQKFTKDVYLTDLDKNVVDFMPNFDETEREPVVLPVRVPNLLLNGAEGIAVGMTTSIPPHNLTEVIDGMKACIKNPEITTKELMNYVKGPDFPTGGIVVNQKDLLSIYESGSGKIKLRGKVEIEKGKKRSEKDRLIISEIPYTMVGANISKFISDIFNLIETKQTTDIIDVSNESSKEGMRIVLELRKNADIDRLEKLLYKKTKLEDTFGVNMLAIANGRPETLSLKQIISYHLEFQYEIQRRKYESLLQKANEQKEIKEGLIRACDMIDLIIEIIRGSKNLAQVKKCLVEGNTENIKFKTKKAEKEASKLRFSQRQAIAILELRLSKLIGLEILTLKREYEDLLKKITQYEEILSKKSAMDRAIIKELDKINKEYGFERKTALENGEKIVLEEIPIEEQNVVFLMDRFGYSKAVDMATYDRNKEAIEKEYKYQVFCTNLDKLGVFTDNGMMHTVKMLDVPITRFREKGVLLDHLCNYDSARETILSLIPLADLGEREFLFVTRKALVKIVDATEFDVVKRTMAATKLGGDDKLVAVKKLDRSVESTDQIILQTDGGYFIKFKMQEISKKKRAALGIRAMKLVGDDEVRNVYLPQMDGKESILYKEKELVFAKLKENSRDTKGTKPRR